MSSLYIAMLMAFLPSPVRIAFYRLTGSKIGKRVKIGFGTVILAKYIEIGDYSVIGYFCRIKVNSLSLGKYVSIGNFVKISVHKITMDSRAKVSATAHIVGNSTDKRSVITLGMHSWIFQHCYIDVARQVTLGKNVGVGGGTYLFTHGSWLSKLDGFPVSYEPVFIEDNVWIPWGCFIMPGAKIGKNVVVGARSLINKDVPENALVAGSPATVIRERAYRDVGLEEKIKIITETIKDFAESKKIRIDRKETDHKIEFCLEKEPFIILYKNVQKNILDLSRTALNVFFDNLSSDVMECYPCFSLNDYLSSSVDIIPKAAIDWLQFISYIGIRFYAIDEM